MRNTTSTTLIAVSCKVLPASTVNASNPLPHFTTVSHRRILTVSPKRLSPNWLVTQTSPFPRNTLHYHSISLMYQKAENWLTTRFISCWWSWWLISTSSETGTVTGSANSLTASDAASDAVKSHLQQCKTSVTGTSNFTHSNQHCHHYCSPA